MTKKTTKADAGILTIKGARGSAAPAQAMIIFGGRTLAEAQDKVFEYVVSRQPVVFQQGIRDFARQKGYTWMSGEFCPTGSYLMRFRGYDLKTFSAAGANPQDAEVTARLVLKCLPDKAVAI